MHLAETPMSDWEKKDKQRREAMKKRLENLPQDNPVVKTSIKKIDRQNNEVDRDQWGIVDDLSSSARGQFIDGDLTFEESVKGLAEALLKAIPNKK